MRLGLLEQLHIRMVQETNQLYTVMIHQGVEQRIIEGSVCIHSMEETISVQGDQQSFNCSAPFSDSRLCHDVLWELHGPALLVHLRSDHLFAGGRAHGAPQLVAATSCDR